MAAKNKAPVVGKTIAPHTGVTPLAPVADRTFTVENRATTPKPSSPAAGKAVGRATAPGQVKKQTGAKKAIGKGQAKRPPAKPKKTTSKAKKK